MRPKKKPDTQRKPASSPSEEEMAVLSFLFTRKPAREESRLAVRHLLRKASRNLERIR
jgi:hypothetical protein